MQSSQLSKHMTLHSDARRYKCTVESCGADFRHSKKHFAAIHSTEGQQRHKRQEQRVAEHTVDFQCVEAGSNKRARVDFLLTLDGDIAAGGGLWVG
jgi:hypothetical protein